MQAVNFVLPVYLLATFDTCLSSIAWCQRVTRYAMVTQLLFIEKNLRGKWKM